MEELVMKTDSDELRNEFRSWTHSTGDQHHRWEQAWRFSATYMNHRSTASVSVLTVSLNNPDVSEMWVK